MGVMYLVYRHPSLTLVKETPIININIGPPSHAHTQQHHPPTPAPSKTNKQPPPRQTHITQTNKQTNKQTPTHTDGGDRLCPTGLAARERRRHGARQTQHLSAVGGGGVGGEEEEAVV
jgi:hypothetical protein